MQAMQGKRTERPRSSAVLGTKEKSGVTIATIHGGRTVPATRMTTLQTKRGKVAIYRWFYHGVLYCTLNWNKNDESTQFIEVIW